MASRITTRWVNSNGASGFQRADLRGTSSPPAGVVTNSLLAKRGIAGRARMMYIDLLYGIKCASNLQTRTDLQNVEDKGDGPTREPEHICVPSNTFGIGIGSHPPRAAILADANHDEG